MDFVKISTELRKIGHTLLLVAALIGVTVFPAAPLALHTPVLIVSLFTLLFVKTRHKGDLVLLPLLVRPIQWLLLAVLQTFRS